MQTADQVEFWRGPEKAGWMYSQGEVIKTWRRRWFILKQGFLFRFADQNIDHSSKPRGIVDLTNVQDVSDGRDATSKSNSIKLSTATGQVRGLLPAVAFDMHRARRCRANVSHLWFGRCGQCMSG